MDNLTQLGSRTELPSSPDVAVIERIAWRETFEAGVPGAMPPPFVRLTAPEFTSLCPATGQPDFAIITVDYHPNAWLVESKSFKLYMGSFRNHGAFHETVVTTIGLRLWRELQPHWLRCAGIFYPRGGIPIDVVWQYGAVREGCYVPELDMRTFRGR